MIPCNGGFPKAVLGVKAVSRLVLDSQCLEQKCNLRLQRPFWRPKFFHLVVYYDLYYDYRHYFYYDYYCNLYNDLYIINIPTVSLIIVTSVQEPQGQV